MLIGQVADMYLGKGLILGRKVTGPVGPEVPSLGLSMDLGSTSPKAQVHSVIRHLRRKLRKFQVVETHRAGGPLQSHTCNIFLGPEDVNRPLW